MPLKPVCDIPEMPGDDADKSYWGQFVPPRAICRGGLQSAIGGDQASEERRTPLRLIPEACRRASELGPVVQLVRTRRS